MKSLLTARRFIPVPEGDLTFFSIGLAFLFFSTIAQATPQFFAVDCVRGGNAGEGVRVTRFHLVGNETSVKLFDDGRITVRGERVNLSQKADSTAEKCPFGYNVYVVVRWHGEESMETTFHPTDWNVLAAESSGGHIVISCGVGSSAETFDSRSAWLDVLHNDKFPKPNGFEGTRADQFKRVCLR